MLALLLGAGLSLQAGAQSGAGVKALAELSLEDLMRVEVVSAGREAERLADVAAPVFVAPTGPAQAAAVPMPPAAAPVEPVSPAASMPAPQMPAPVAARLPHEPAMSLEDIELRTIQQAVDAAGGNISVAAKRLGISRNTIYRKLRWRSDGR